MFLSNRHCEKTAVKIRLHQFCELHRLLWAVILEIFIRIIVWWELNLFINRRERAWIFKTKINMRQSTTDSTFIPPELLLLEANYRAREAVNLEMSLKRSTVVLCTEGQFWSWSACKNLCIIHMLCCTGIQTDLTPDSVYINPKIVEKELGNYIKTVTSETTTLITPGKDAFTAANNYETGNFNTYEWRMPTGETLSWSTNI